MEITFSEKAFWNGDREGVVFYASAHNKRIRCIVSYAFLTDPVRESPTEERALELFRTRRSEIESIVQARIERNATEKSDRDSVDEIMIRSNDATMI